jgi:prepilin-type N-terminal cleavage/methylation domain-containing protein
MDTNKMKRNLAGKSLVGQAGMTLLEILIVLAIIALVMGFLFGPRLLEMLGESKKERAGILVDEYANKAYTQWILNNPGKHCPEGLGELAKYTNHEDTKDPWGNEFVMVCGDSAPDGVPNRMGIISMGEDGKPDTDDDIRSWGKKK